MKNLKTELNYFLKTQMDGIYLNNFRKENYS